MAAEEGTNGSQVTVHYCATHPRVQTGLACSKCGKYICPRCMVQTPVGARCRECGRVQRVPTFEVRPGQLALAIIAAVVLALALGTAWGLLLAEIHRVPFFPWLIAVGVGYAMGESISVVTNRRRATSLAWIAGLATVAAFLISGYVFAEVAGVKFLLRDLFGLLILGLAVYVAITRVR